MVHARVGARFFDGHDVVRLFHHADGPAIARGPGAVQAGIRVSDVVADGAFADFFFCVANGVGERQGVFRRRAQQKESEALRGFLSDAGEVLQFIDQAFDRSGEIRHVGGVA